MCLRWCANIQHGDTTQIFVLETLQSCLSHFTVLGVSCLLILEHVVLRYQITEHQKMMALSPNNQAFVLLVITYFIQVLDLLFALTKK